MYPKSPKGDPTALTVLNAELVGLRSRFATFEERVVKLEVKLAELEKALREAKQEAQRQ